MAEKVITLGKDGTLHCPSPGPARRHRHGHRQEGVRRHRAPLRDPSRRLHADRQAGPSRRRRRGSGPAGARLKASRDVASEEMTSQQPAEGETKADRPPPGVRRQPLRRFADSKERPDYPGQPGRGNKEADRRERPAPPSPGAPTPACHARGQVASFLTRRPFDVDGVRGRPELLAAGRHRRPAGAWRSPLDFDVRRRARQAARTATWSIAARRRSPLLRQRSWHVKEPLDLGGDAGGGGLSRRQARFRRLRRQPGERAGRHRPHDAPVRRCGGAAGWSSSTRRPTLSCPIRCGGQSARSWRWGWAGRRRRRFEALLRRAPGRRAPGRRRRRRGSA